MFKEWRDFLKQILTWTPEGKEDWPERVKENSLEKERERDEDPWKDRDK